MPQSITIQAQTQQHELEQAVYQQSMRSDWSYTDSFFRHVNNCVDSECDVCRPHEDNDSLF